MSMVEHDAETCRDSSPKRLLLKVYITLGLKHRAPRASEYFRTCFPDLKIVLIIKCLNALTHESLFRSGTEFRELSLNAYVN